MQTDNLLNAHKQIMRAASGEASFEHAIAAISDAFGSADGVVFALNRKTGQITNWISPGLVAGDNAYSHHINSINPRMRYSLQHAAGHVLYEHKFIDPQAMARHEFYDWLSHSHGFGYFLGSRLYDDGDISVFHSLEFEKKGGHPDQEQVDIFRNTSHALGNALRIASRAPQPENAADLGAWTPNHLPWSIFALSGRGQVLQMNDAARAMIEDGHVLTLTSGTLAACHKNSATIFSGAILSALAGVSSDILLQGAVNGRRLVAQVLPISKQSILSPNPIAALVYVWNPSDNRRNIDEKLTRLWQLTPVEAALAARLARGESLTEAAEQLGLPRNTTRNQLQRIFAKTGTSGQVELISLIFGIISQR